MLVVSCVCKVCVNWACVCFCGCVYTCMLVSGTCDHSVWGHVIQTIVHTSVLCVRVYVCVCGSVGVEMYIYFYVVKECIIMNLGLQETCWVLNVPMIDIKKREKMIEVLRE